VIRKFNPGGFFINNAPGKNGAFSEIISKLNDPKNEYFIRFHIIIDSIVRKLYIPFLYIPVLMGRHQ